MITFHIFLASEVSLVLCSIYHQWNEVMQLLFEKIINNLILKCILKVGSFLVLDLSFDIFLCV